MRRRRGGEREKENKDEVGRGGGVLKSNMKITGNKSKEVKYMHC